MIRTVDPRFSPLSKARSDSRFVKRGETDYSRIVPRIGSDRIRLIDVVVVINFKIDVVVIDFKIKNPN